MSPFPTQFGGKKQFKLLGTKEKRDEAFCEKYPSLIITASQGEILCSFHLVLPVILYYAMMMGTAAAILSL